MCGLACHAGQRKKALCRMHTPRAQWLADAKAKAAKNGKAYGEVWTFNAAGN